MSIFPFPHPKFIEAAEMQRKNRFKVPMLYVKINKDGKKEYFESNIDSFVSIKNMFEKDGSKIKLIRWYNFNHRHWKIHILNLYSIIKYRCYKIYKNEKIRKGTWDIVKLLMAAAIGWFSHKFK